MVKDWSSTRVYQICIFILLRKGTISRRNFILHFWLIFKYRITSCQVLITFVRSDVSQVLCTWHIFKLDFLENQASYEKVPFYIFDLSLHLEHQSSVTCCIIKRTLYILRDILRSTKRIANLFVPVSKQKSSRHRERVREKEIIELKRLLHRVDRLQAYHFDLSRFFAVTPRPWRIALAILILWLDSGCTIKRAEHLNQITRASTG